MRRAPIAKRVAPFRPTRLSAQIVEDSSESDPVFDEICRYGMDADTRRDRGRDDAVLPKHWSANSPKAEKGDWQAVVLPLAAVVGLVLLLVMSVR